MTAVAQYIFGCVCALLGLVSVRMVIDEVRGQLDRLPQLIVRIAAKRVPAAMREELRSEWSAEVCAITDDRAELPISRLIAGIGASLGWLCRARRIAAERENLPEKTLERMIVLWFGFPIAFMNASFALPGGSTGPLWFAVSTAVVGGGASFVYLSMATFNGSLREWPRLTCCVLAAAVMGATAIMVGLPVVGIVAAAIAVAGMVVGRVRGDRFPA